jgi:beta-galactosidase
MTRQYLPDRFSLGVCYYPEHWPEDRWPIYARQMRELGLTYARIAEFAWSRMEPSEGEWQWDWLDRAIDSLAQENLGVILGTPTGSPPPWLLTAHPSVLPVDNEGRIRTHGSRKHYDHSSHVYLSHCQRIVTAMAERYGNHDAILGWQIDNEWGESESTRSYSPASLTAFRIWLRDRYGSPEALTGAWGGAFWSQEYSAWDQIPLPNLTMNEANPSHLLDFYRFSSDAIVMFQNAQVDIIRQHSPGRFITHNGMGNFDEVDYYRVADTLDFMSWDSYPLGQTDKGLLPGIDVLDWARVGHPDLIALNHDLIRGLKAGPGPIVMEQQAGQVNWVRSNPLPADGGVSLWTIQAWAHGCDSVCYFRWRAGTVGQELMHSGLLRHDESFDRGAVEIADLALPDDPLSAPQARVVFLHDYESGWVADAQRHTAEWSSWMQMMLFFSTIRRLGVDVDFRHPDADLSGYDVIIAPSMQIVGMNRARHLASYARDAHIIVGPRTAFRAETGQVHPDGQPGPLRGLLGCSLLNFDGMWPGMTVEVDEEQVTTWAESYRPEAGHALFTYDDGPLKGQAAVVRNGNAITIGALGPILIGRVLAMALTEARIPVHVLDEGLRVSRRGGRTIWMNFNEDQRRLPDGRMIDGVSFLIS